MTSRVRLMLRRFFAQFQGLNHPENRRGLYMQRKETGPVQEYFFSWLKSCVNDKALQIGFKILPLMRGIKLVLRIDLYLRFISGKIVAAE